MRTIGSPVLAQLRQHATKSKQAEVLTGLRAQSTVIPKPTTFTTSISLLTPFQYFKMDPALSQASLGRTTGCSEGGGT